MRADFVPVDDRFPQSGPHLLDVSRIGGDEEGSFDAVLVHQFHGAEHELRRIVHGVSHYGMSVIEVLRLLNKTHLWQGGATAQLILLQAESRERVAADDANRIIRGHRDSRGACQKNTADDFFHNALRNNND